ncbi:MAG: class II aldolase/adducin family protein, partial [Terricaulis sp.]
LTREGGWGGSGGSGSGSGRRTRPPEGGPSGMGGGAGGPGGPGGPGGEGRKRDLGDKNLMLLRNHGTLAVGSSAAAAFVGIFFLERACAQQVAALSAGRENVLIAPDDAQEETRNGPAKAMGGVSGLAWPGLKRKLDRELPGYDS